MPRVGNKKSRFGCKRCKDRKVKCDEQTPSCGWCKSHSLSCEYPSTRKGRVVNLVHRESSSSKHDPPILNQSPEQKHLLELGLLHYYVLNVAFAYPSRDREYSKHVHADMIPQEGLRSASLLHAMYAYALLHIHVKFFMHGKLPRNASFFESLGVRLPNDQNPTSNLLALHRHYLDLAIQEQRQAVSNITKENADGTTLTAVLMATTVLVHTSYAHISAPENEASYQLPLQWFYFSQSIGTCLKVTRPLLSSDSATDQLIFSQPPPSRGKFNPDIGSPFRHVLHWQPPSNPEVFGEGEEEVYKSTLAYIESLHSQDVENEPWELLARRVIAFPNLAPKSFLTFLEEGRPRALVMLATLLCLTKRIGRSYWIFHNVADYHVNGISSLVSQEWQWALDWPKLYISDDHGPSSDMNVNH